MVADISIRYMLGRNFVSAIAVVVTSVASAQVTPGQLDAADRYVRRSRAVHGLPGVAIAVATQDSVLLAQGYGAASDGSAIAGHTPFYGKQLRRELPPDQICVSKQTLGHVSQERLSPNGCHVDDHCSTCRNVEVKAIEWPCVFNVMAPE